MQKHHYEMIERIGDALTKLAFAMTAFLVIYNLAR